MAAGPSNTNAKTPPPPGQQAMKTASAAAGAVAGALGQPSAEPGKAAKQANIPTQGLTGPEVLHQTKKLPFSPGKLAVGGFAVVVGIAYFTLYSNKKPEATAVDVAKVTTGIGSPGNNRRG